MLPSLVLLIALYAHAVGCPNQALHHLEYLKQLLSDSDRRALADLYVAVVLMNSPDANAIARVEAITSNLRRISERVRLSSALLALLDYVEGVSHSRRNELSEAKKSMRHCLGVSEQRLGSAQLNAYALSLLADVTRYYDNSMILFVIYLFIYIMIIIVIINYHDVDY